MLGFRNRDNGNGDVRPEVKDVQDDFLNIYRRVYDKEKSWAKRFTEEAAPQTQKDFGVIESIENKKDNLLKNLQDKLNEINSVTIKDSGNFDDFSRSYDIIKPYNEIIRMYLNPENNSKTREEIKSKIQEIGPLVNQIIYAANTTFKSVFFNPRKEMNKRISIGIKVLVPMISTYIALLLMQKNLFRGTYSTINKPQLDVQYKEWLTYLDDDDRTYMKSIETPTGASEALLERQRLIEEDRGYPLSAVERLNLRNSMFGISSNKQYSPAELANLEAEDRRDAAAYRDYRKELNENRGLFGFERADLIDKDEAKKARRKPEPVAEGGPIAEGEPIAEAEPIAEGGPVPALFDEVRVRRDRRAPEPVGEAKDEPEAVSPEDREARFNAFLRETARLFNDYLADSLAPTKNIETSVAQQRALIKEGLDFLVGSYRDAYRMINELEPTAVEERRFIDNAINSQIDSNGEPNLTEEAIYSRGNPRDTEQKRMDIYQSLLNVLDYTTNREIYGVGRIGEGEPKRRLNKKVSQALHYDDARNDPYLIR